ncbi:MAG: IgA Peptidase M64 [Bacteroidales bacterium]|nr:IgA Peptidase M64 [Bacteroidales bacterium]
MRVSVIILVLFSFLSTSAQFARHFKNQTLRFDYFHSGNFEDEYIVQDEILKEGPWAGPRKNLIDPFDYGSYKLLVFDLRSDKLIYSRGYSSLFIEYQATEEAKTECGNFPESMLLPMPRRPVRLEIHSRGKDMVWNKTFETAIDPKKDDISGPAPSVYPVEVIHNGKNPRRMLDIVFLPEGYTAEEMDKFLADCHRYRDSLFATRPFEEYKDRINIRAVLALSEESGTDILGDSIWRNTLLNSSFYTFGSERYLTTADFKTVRNVAARAPYDQIVILVNHPKYGGGGIYNFYAITTVDDRNSGFVFTHEFGHSFAGLGDEYQGSGTASDDYYDITQEPWEPNITSLVDFDAKWKDMLPVGTPVPTPVSDEWQGKLGVFEGAGYMEKGLYRPYPDCSMNIIKFDNFCPVCQRAIRRMIGYFIEH